MRSRTSRLKLLRSVIVDPHARRDGDAPPRGALPPPLERTTTRARVRATPRWHSRPPSPPRGGKAWASGQEVGHADEPPAGSVVARRGPRRALAGRPRPPLTPRATGRSGGRSEARARRGCRARRTGR